jgi:DNA-binding NtrC family response regulator
VISEQTLEKSDSDDAGRNKHVQTLLLVDDEPNVLNALIRVLRRDGYRILVATCGDEALAILAREDVQVVISDQRMPGMSGMELLGKVRETHPEIVRILLSGDADFRAVREAVSQGTIYQFFAKPWNDEELRLQIQNAFLMHKTHIRE